MGFVDGILFAEKKKPVVPKEEEPDEEEKEDTLTAMTYSNRRIYLHSYPKYLHQQNPLQAHPLTSLKKDWHF